MGFRLNRVIVTRIVFNTESVRLQHLHFFRFWRKYEKPRGFSGQTLHRSICVKRSLICGRNRGVGGKWELWAHGNVSGHGNVGGM